MKALRCFVLPAVLFFWINSTNAQEDAASAGKRAIIFADSLLKSFNHNNLDRYTDLSYPGVISYYGGKKNFREYLQRAKALNISPSADNLAIFQLVNDHNEWQCVIEKTCATLIDGKKATIVSYLVGQSKDEGHSWKFFDVALNSAGNLVYIMPDISESLTVPQRRVLFEKGEEHANL